MNMLLLIHIALGISALISATIMLLGNNTRASRWSIGSLIATYLTGGVLLLTTNASIMHFCTSAGIVTVYVMVAQYITHKATAAARIK